MESSHQFRDVNRLNVLVVDDDPMLADFIDLSLQALGCQTSYAGSAEEALRLIDENIDLLVTDWQMPEMDGMELVRRVRAQRSPESHLHIAMMTGRDDSGAMFAALQAGVDDFLYKPVNGVQLQLAVSTARRNRMLHRRLQRRNQLLSVAHARTREALQAVRNDLDAAAALHERLLPKAERLEGLNVAHIYQPALMLGGDTIGTSNLGNGRTLFFLIDVRGHGVPAALDSFHLHHRLKQFRPDSPEALMEAAGSLNREIAERSDDSYATMLAGIIDAPTRQGWIVRAGHPPPVLLQDGRTTELAAGGSMPLGWFADGVFTAEQFDFRGTGRLVIYSDGVTECNDKVGQEFGSDNLIRLIEGTAQSTLTEFMVSIEEALDLRGINRTPQDDVSLLAIELLCVDESRS